MTDPQFETPPSQLSTPDFRALFESAPGLYLVLTPDFRIVAVSDAYLRATLTKREEILGRGICEVFPDNPTDPSATGVSNLLASLQRVVQHRAADAMAVQKYDLRRSEADAGGFHDRYWSPVNSPVFGANNEVAYIIHRVEDVTEFVHLKQVGVEQHPAEEILARRGRRSAKRKRSQASLREAYVLLRAVTHGTTDAVFVKDLCGRYLMINPAGAAFLGRSVEDVLRRDDTELFSPETAEKIIAEDRRVLVEEQTRTYEEVGTSGGLTRTYLSTKGPYRDADGKVIGLVGISRDITDRKRAEDEIRRQQEWLRVTLSSIGDAVIATDTAGLVMFMNPIAEMLTGWHQGEASGRPLTEIFHIVHEDTREPVENSVSKVLREGSVQGLTHHSLLIAKHGAERPIADSAAPIRDPAGNTHGVVLVFHDVSEQRELERQLRERAEKLADAHRRKDEFLAMLAHELRNPLAPLRNALHILRVRGSEPGQLEQVRELMERQVEHLGRMVEDLLDVSRITRGKITLRRQRLDWARLVRLGVEDRRSTLEAAGVQLTLAVPETPVWVTGDPTRLAQILDNLLENAMKFAEGTGRVTVQLGVSAQEQEAVLTVSDTGVGIAPDILTCLFEPFVQADRSLDRSRGGLGLGLALVKGLVTLHGGRVTAHSEGLGRGARFTLWLPREKELPALVAEPVSSAPPKKPWRVLVVEDNRDSADSLRMLLELCGYEVTVAYTGPAGVEAAVRARPDIVLCDIGLPGMDGFAVARALRQNTATAAARLIAVTGYGQDEDRQRAFQAGFDEHLVKPVDPEELLGHLEPVLPR